MPDFENTDISRHDEPQWFEPDEPEVAAVEAFDDIDLAITAPNEATYDELLASVRDAMQPPDLTQGSLDDRRLHPSLPHVLTSRGIKPGEITVLKFGDMAMPYTKSAEQSWSTERDIYAYRRQLFPDNTDGTMAPRDRVSTSEIEAFHGKVVLDLGSGEAIALRQYAEAYPDSTFIGVDKGYHEETEINVQRSGLQLTYDDWKYLHSIADATVDTIISVRGVVPWGISSELAESELAADALTRVAKPGAIFRFELLPTSKERPYVTRLLRDRGWKVRTIEDEDGRTKAAIEARKQQ